MAQTDRDLASIAEARSLARRAKAAAPVLAEFSQDFIVISLCRTIIIIRIAGLLEIILNRAEAGLQLAPALVEESPVLFDILPRR